MKNIDEPVHAFRVLPPAIKRPTPAGANAAAGPDAIEPFTQRDTRTPQSIRRLRRGTPWLAAFIVMASLITALVLWQRRERPELSGPKVSSIAVLPFVDMSERHDQEYFSDGLSEELIDQLSNAPGLKVIARTSS